MASVVFDVVTFKARYPEFNAVAEPLLQAYFTEATLYLSNADNSPVQDLARRALFLYMLTAHIAYINGALNADGSANPVGRVSSASEGSVSVSLEYQTPGSAAWFVTSQYGAAYWQATSSLRQFRYIAQPTRY